MTPDVTIVVREPLIPRVYEHPEGWKLTLSPRDGPPAISLAGSWATLRTTLLYAQDALDEAQRSGR